MGAPTILFCFKGATLIDPSPIFLEHWAVRNRKQHFGTLLQIIYMKVEMCPTQYGIKLRC
jgi:hypothetical protein